MSDVSFRSIKELYEQRDELLENGYEELELRFYQSGASTGARTTGVDFD